MDRHKHKGISERSSVRSYRDSIPSITEVPVSQREYHKLSLEDRISLTSQTRMDICSIELEVSPPQNLIGQIYVPGKLMMGPGPSNCPARVLDSMGLHVIGHMHKEFFQIMNDIKAGLKYVFQTQNPWSLVISGPGHAGMETLLFNLMEPEDKVLVGVNGLWGTRVADLVVRLGGVAIKLETDAGTRFSTSEISAALQVHKPKILFLVHAESSTGVIQPLEDIGDMCRSNDCLFCVDAVASVGGCVFLMDKWKIDAVYTCSQKALGGSPGLSPVSFSPRAVAKIKARSVPVKSFLFDMNLLANYWACNGNDVRAYHHTPPVHLMYALREALSLIATERLENIWQRHIAVSRRLQFGLQSMGLQFYVENESDRLPTVTTVKIPQGIRDSKLILQYAMEKYLIEISGGLGPTAGQVLRIGVFGFNAYPVKVDRLLQAVKEGLDYAKLYGKL